MKKILGLLVMLVCLTGWSGTTVVAQELQFKKEGQVRKMLRMGKPNDAQAVINELVKKDNKASKKKPKTDEPLVAEGTEFDDSYLDGKKPEQAKDSTEYYFLTGLLKHNQYEQENLKMYLKNKPDTAAYFKRQLEMMDALMHCYPALNQLKRQDKEARALMHQYKGNLEPGGGYFTVKKDMNTAFKFFDMYVKLSEKELIVPVDTILNKCYYNSAFIANEMKNNAVVVDYGRKLVERGQGSESVDMLICQALQRAENIDEWKEALKEAIKRHPESFFFYAALIDHYIAHNEAPKALKYADELQKNDPMNGLKSFVKGYVYQNTGDYHNAIIWQEVCNQLEPNVPENLSALGFNYVAVAEDYEANLRGNRTTEEARKTLKEYYVKAKGYLEECRKVVPEKTEFWASPLLKVYYNLNDGDGYDEIDNLLKNKR